MGFPTDGLVIRRNRDLLGEIESGQLETAGATFQQTWFENPTTAVRRINELTAAQQGEVTQPAYPAYGIKEQRAEPSTPMLTAEEARRRVEETGLKIAIDDAGIRQGALDILIERKNAERERKQVLDNAPGSTVPIQLLSGFAASLLDPINVASAFVPVVGEARAASMLARAGSSTLGRAGARAQIGVVEGAVGAALVEPLVLRASQQDQADYGISNTLLNIAFGGLLGGGLHSVGGAVSDRLRGNVLESLRVDPENRDIARMATPETPRRTTLAEAVARGDDDPITALRTSLERGLQADRAAIYRDAQAQAREEIIPELTARIDSGEALQEAAQELTSVRQQISEVGQSLSARIEQNRSEGMNPVQSVAEARRSVAAEQRDLRARESELVDEATPEGQDRVREALARGEVPERVRAEIDSRAGRLAEGFELSGTARAVANQSPWFVREAALRSAIAQAATGRPVQVEPLFNLADPLKRQEAITQLKEAGKTVADPEGEVSGYIAGQANSALEPASLPAVRSMLADEQALTDALAKQLGIDNAAALRDADALVADAETFSAAFRAAAVCQLRT